MHIAETLQRRILTTLPVDSQRLVEFENLVFSTSNSFKLRYFPLVCFLLGWKFFVLHRACTHARACTLTRTYMRVFTYEDAHMQTPAQFYTHSYSHTHAVTLTRMHPLTLERWRIRKHTLMHAHVPSCACRKLHTCPHNRTCTHAHIHIHARACTRIHTAYAKWNILTIICITLLNPSK